MGKKLIQDFIIPALNSQKYGELLKWVNHSEGIFQIKWSHKNAARWCQDDTALFQGWDRLKGHYRPEKKGYYMQAKQRFRAALQKLKPSVIRLDTADKGFKNYRLLDVEGKRKLKAEKDKKKLTKKTTVKAIPTSVICQNMSYNRNIASSPSVSPGPSCSSSSLSMSQESYVSSLSNESSELEMLEQSYKSAQEKQMRSIERISSDEETMSCGEASDSDQKENVENQTQRVLPPHIPIQPSPTYNMIPIYENFSTPRYESPQILLVKTHYEAKPRPVRNYNIGCVMVEPPSALNLSVKHNW